jgi:hypothetical protein
MVSRNRRWKEHIALMKQQLMQKVWDTLEHPKFSFELPQCFYHQFVAAKTHGLPVQRTSITRKSHISGGLSIYYRLSQRDEAFEKLQKLMPVRYTMKKNIAPAILGGLYRRRH